MPSNVLPLRLKQTFPPIIWILTEGEGDEIQSRLPFKIFSTLLDGMSSLQNWGRFGKNVGPVSSYWNPLTHIVVSFMLHA